MWENAVLKRAIEEAPRKGGNHEGHQGSQRKGAPLASSRIPLLVAQGYHGINFRGSSCRNVAGGERD